MCGIAGIFHQEGRVPDSTLLHHMATLLHHRGPDERGIEIIDHFGLAHTRLSIIDLSQGHQPLHHPQGFTLIANGEIYNYLELRQEFHAYPYKTQSDCEVIFPLYEKYGLDCVKYLRGMYAFALYDPLKKICLIARDPFGIKQLYYCETDQTVFFASEPRAFLKSNIVPPDLHEDVLSEALQLRYTLSEQTIFKHIKRLLPGEVCVLKNGKMIDRLQNVSLPPQNLCNISEDEALERLEKALKDSVKVHLRSDVPYGLFLSGGLDSATILAFMHQYAESDIKTYTIGFTNTHVHDERHQASLLARHFSTHHTEVNFDEMDFWNLLPQVAEAVDDLQIDMASLPTFKLAQIARHDVKVVLCGEGGDEMLAGYGRYRKTKLPKWLGGRIIREKGSLDKAGIGEIVGRSWRKTLEDIEKQKRLLYPSTIQISQAIDVSSWLANGLLIKLDRCLMANSLEGRTPFLDPVVAQQTFYLKDKLKVRRGHGKWILRQWLEKNLPEAKPFAKKRGFTVPVGEWIHRQHKTIAPLVARQAGITDLLSEKTVLRLFQDPGKHAQFAAWTLLFYAIWHQIHVLGHSPGPNAMETLSS